MSSNSNMQNYLIDSSENNDEERKRFNITESVIARQVPDEEMINEYSKEWSSLESYLDVMTKLTLESFFRPLRIYLDQLKNNQLDPRDLYLYRNVFVSPWYYSIGNIEHDLFVRFDVRGPTYSENGEIKEYDWKVNWEHTERLKKSSLLIFSKSQYMDTIDAVAFSCAEQGSIINNQVEIKFLQGKLELSQAYFMFEPTSYWNQVIIDNLLNTNESTIPSWIKMPFLNFDFSYSQIDNKIDPSTIKDGIFDEEQLLPFKYCLNNRLTLVNGAPGTGKSYLGRELVKFLIKSNYQYPIMLVTYKNIALDSFLEKISGFLEKENVPFIRIGGYLKTNNKVIKENNYFPKTPEPIQIKKKQLMLVNSLIIFINDCIFRELYYRFYNNFTFVVIDEIDKVINIRKMMYDDYPLYSKEDELLITNIFNPKEFIPPARFYFCLFAINGYHQQLRQECHNKVNQHCNVFLEQLQKYYEERGKGVYNVDIERTISNHFSNDGDELYNFLYDNYDFLYSEKEDEQKKVLYNIIKQSDFSANELRSVVEKNDQLSFIELSPKFIKTICKKFENLRSTQFEFDKFYIFMTDLHKFLTNKKKNLEEKIFEMNKEYEKNETERLGIELSSKKLIAVTATRAAQFKESLDRSNCKFVIVEEAGQLTEPITFSIIPKTTEQIIMIGDYNQLRPKVYLGMAKNPFNPHISLFEKEVRHAKQNKLPNLFTLSIQRRMHPEISSLIRSVLYFNNARDEKLIDHESTKSLNKPNGFPNHLQFWLHNYNEKPPDKFERSYSNIQEAKICAYLFLMMLCRGYKSTEITILASYKGQKKQIIKELVDLIDKYYADKEISCYDAFDFENDVCTGLTTDKKSDFKQLIEIRKKLTRNFVKCLDDFQGEENEVVILSLTRSSDLGFLRERNRSLVSLSRAKQMEIVVGNKSLFGDENGDKLWQRIYSQLIYSNRKVTPHNGITVNACQCHEKKLNPLQRITSLDELLCYRFNHCKSSCSSFHDCNHQCQLTCHYHQSMRPKIKKIFERRYYCPMQCENKCREGHQCIGMCGECKRFGCPDCQLCRELSEKPHEDK